MAVTISILSGGNSPRTLTLDQDEITIGRGPGVDVQLHPEDLVCASHIHARLQHADQTWTLVVEHRNGLLVRPVGGVPRFLEQGQKTALPADAELAIGRNGPRLHFRSAAARTAASAAGELTVRIVSGFNSPWSRTFDQDVVTIGRDPGADVRLHPLADTAVASGIHANLSRSNGNWFLTVMHRSGVQVTRMDGGKIALGPGQRLAIDTDCNVKLGRGGPLLRVALPLADTALPVTCAGRQNRFPLFGSEASPEPCDGAGRRRTGFRPRLLWIAGVAALLLIAAATSLGSKSKEQFGFLQSATKSVYMLGATRPDGTFIPVGTGWSVGDKLLATNCHVADALEAHRDQGLTLVARRPGTPPEDTQLSELSEHPAWARFRPLMKTVFRSKIGTAASMHSCFDVALVRTTGAVGPGLPLASMAEIRGLCGGQPIAYVGFPMEDVSGVQGNQPATTTRGSVTAVHDMLGQSANFEMSIMFQHDLPTLGGASGSPIFNARGHVVGLVNSGHFIFLADKRIPTGLEMGQRVDLLQDLLDGRAEQRLPQYEAYITSQLLAAGADAAHVVISSVHAQRGEWEEEGAIPENNPVEVLLQSFEKPPQSGEAAFTVNVKRGCRYVFVTAAADFSPVTIEVQQNGVTLGREEGLCGRVAFQATATGSVAIRAAHVNRKNRALIAVLGAELPLVQKAAGR